MPRCEDVEPAPADTRVWSADEVAAAGDRFTPPQKLSGPDPQYSDEAIRHCAQGTMLVACRVMTNGCAIGCRVVQSLPYMDARVLSALQRRHYRPATLDGKPVNAEYTFKVNLRLMEPRCKSL